MVTGSKMTNCGSNDWQTSRGSQRCHYIHNIPSAIHYPYIRWHYQGEMASWLWNGHFDRYYILLNSNSEVSTSGHSWILHKYCRNHSFDWTRNQHTSQWVDSAYCIESWNSFPKSLGTCISCIVLAATPWLQLIRNSGKMIWGLTWFLNTINFIELWTL